MKLVRLSTAGKRNVGDPEDHIHTDLTNLFLWSQGRVRFGTGVDGDRGENIDGEFQVFTSNATPDTADSITHTLGSIPIGFIVINLDKGAVVYDSGTAWTTTTISFKTTVASTLVTVFLLK